MAPEDSLNIETETVDGSVIVRPHGDIDLASSPELRASENLRKNCNGTSTSCYSYGRPLTMPRRKKRLHSLSTRKAI